MVRLASSVLMILAAALGTARGSDAPNAIPVVEASVRQADVPIVLTGLGTAHPLNVATIRSQITGTLETVDFVEGRQVHRGDVLARLDPRPYQARLDEAEAQLGRDQAQLASLQVNLRRNMPLLSHGFATEQQVTDEQFRVAELKASVRYDQAAIEAARTELSYATLTAPFDGVTGIRRIDIGNIVHPNDPTGIVKLDQLQPIAVIFTLPTADIPKVEDALARGPVQARAYDQSGTHLLDTGTLLLVDNEADPRSGTVQLKAMFPNRARRIWPGGFVDVALTISTVKGGLTVPMAAVQQGPNGPFVYTVGSNDTVSIRPVRVAQQRDATALVTQGLHPGETVVVKGQYRLTDGAHVVAAPPEQVASSSAAADGLLP